MYACLTLNVLNGLWSVVLSSGLKYMSEVTYTCRYLLSFSGKLLQITRIKISYLIYINLLSVPGVRPIDICNTKYVRYGHVQSHIIACCWQFCHAITSAPRALGILPGPGMFTLATVYFQLFPYQPLLFFSNHYFISENEWKAFQWCVLLGNNSLATTCFA